MKKVHVAVENHKVAVLGEMHQNQVNTAFKKFVEAPMPSGVDIHNIPQNEVVFRVFDFTPASGSGILLDSEGTSIDTLGYRTFPFAKILIAGEASGYERGQIVRLVDMEVATIDNPGYHMWTHAQRNKPLLSELKGQEPPRLINNLSMNNILMSKIFFLEPLRLGYSAENIVTFKVDASYIDYTIDNYEDFII